MRILALLLPLLLLGACASTQVGDAAPALHRGALVAAAQTQDVFAETNRSARAVDIERVLLRADVSDAGLPRIEEADFEPVVDPETAAQWAAIFDAITGYTGSLVRLTDPVLAASVGDQLQLVGTNFGRLAGPPSARVGKVSAVVGALGEAIVSARAERTAAGVVRRTDPAFQELVAAMADALGADDASGLRGTVADQWSRAMLPALATRFGREPPAHRRAIAGEYVEALDGRDRALSAFARLRQALLSLGAAHQAAAMENPASAAAWIDRLERVSDDIARRMGR
ncbi:MAG: hypothetical protein ACK4TG_01415 [Thermaurantiacus sp.]